MIQSKYEGKYLDFYEYRDEKTRWEFVRRPKSIQGVTIVAATEKKKIVLVEQYRIPFGKLVIELPAGLVGDDDPNDTVEAATRRELEEETGYLCENVEIICKGSLLPGLTDEINSLSWAKHLTSEKIADNTGDGQVYRHEMSHGIEEQGERIRVYDVPLTTAEKWLKEQMNEGKVVDLKAYLGVFFLRNVFAV